MQPLEALTGPREELDVNVVDLTARVVVVSGRKCLRESQTHKTFTSGNSQDATLQQYALAI